MNTTSGVGKYFSLDFFNGDNTLTVQLGARDWRVKNGGKTRVTMQVDGEAPWGAVGREAGRQVLALNHPGAGGADVTAVAARPPAGAPTKRIASATTTPSALSVSVTPWLLLGWKSKAPSCCQLLPLVFWLTAALEAPADEAI